MRSPIVLCSAAMDPSGTALLEGAASIVVPPEADGAALARLLPQADYLVVRTFLPEDLLDQPHRLRAIVRHGSGLDMIPMQAATRQGLPVAYVPGANAQAVAEHVVASLFELTRRLGKLDAAIRQDGWNAGRALATGATELAGKTIGIIGVGAIGRRIAGMCAQGLGMRVLGHQADASRFPEHVSSVALDDLLGRSDFVSINCPLTDTTRHLIDGRRLGLMKPTAFLINTARGPVVEEESLVRALRDRSIAGAALDVFASQPLAQEHPLIHLDNVLLTPHVAALTRESVARMSVGTADALLRLMRGEAPAHLANPEVWQSWPHRASN